MQLTHLILAAVLALTHPITAFTNTSREFYLKTVLRPESADKPQFDNLYLIPYHTGAGFNDVVLSPTNDVSVKAFFNGSFGVHPFHNLLFDLGNDFPWYMDMEINTNFYAAWEPVGINVDQQKPGGFYFNGTDGLQWTAAPSQKPTPSEDQFGGWLVCDWWHGSPQLFFRVAYYSIDDYPAPCSCADVYLVREFI